MDQGPTSSR